MLLVAGEWLILSGSSSMSAMTGLTTMLFGMFVLAGSVYHFLPCCCMRSRTLFDSGDKAKAALSIQ
jgi:hypothetical protein